MIVHNQRGAKDGHQDFVDIQMSQNYMRRASHLQPDMTPQVFPRKYQFELRDQAKPRYENYQSG